MDDDTLHDIDAIHDLFYQKAADVIGGQLGQVSPIQETHVTSFMPCLSEGWGIVTLPRLLTISFLRTCAYILCKSESEVTFSCSCFL